MHRIRFEKTGRAVWMSHLDLMRLMQRAFRRAGVVLHHSQGFTPHAYVSMLLPLSVGMESVCELMEYELDGELAVTSEALNAVLPEGVRVLEANGFRAAAIDAVIAAFEKTRALGKG